MRCGMNRRLTRVVWLVLLGSSLLLFAVSCSTIKDILSFRDSKQRITPEEKRAAKLVSTLRSRPGNPDSHFLLASYYQERGKHRDAIEEFKKTILIAPDHLKAYNGMGVSYDLLGDYPRAIESYSKALALDPNLDYVQNNLGYSYLLQGNVDEAIASLQKAIALNKQETRFHNNLALAHAEKREFALAFAEFKLAGGEAKAHFNMAQIYQQKHIYEEARMHYRTAMRLDPLLTGVRTALEAADALSRIFESDTVRAEAKALIIPENRPVQSVENLVDVKTERQVIQEVQTGIEREDRSEAPRTAAKASPRDETGQASSKGLAASEQLLPTLPYPHAAMPAPYKDNALKASASLEVSASADSQMPGKRPYSYELQIACYRSRENAIMAGKSLQGYPCTVRPWKSKEGEEWYRLLVGPFLTREEAEISKGKIGKRHQVEPFIIQTSSADSGAENQAIESQRDEKEWQRSLKKIGVEISNGNGMNGMAKRVRCYLNEKGLNVIRITNADHFGYAETKVFYQKGYQEAAEYMASQLALIRKTERLNTLDRPNIKVKVLIGRDLIPHSKLFENGGRS